MTMPNLPPVILLAAMMITFTVILYGAGCLYAKAITIRPHRWWHLCAAVGLIDLFMAFMSVQESINRSFIGISREILLWGLLLQMGMMVFPAAIQEIKGWRR